MKKVSLVALAFGLLLALTTGCVSDNHNQLVAEMVARKLMDKQPPVWKVTTETEIEMNNNLNLNSPCVGCKNNSPCAHHAHTMTTTNVLGGPKVVRQSQRQTHMSMSPAAAAVEIVQHQNKHHGPPPPISLIGGYGSGNLPPHGHNGTGTGAVGGYTHP